MAGPLDLRGRVTITNGASGTLGVIQRQLQAIGTMSDRAKRQVGGVLGGSARGAPVGSLGFGMAAFGFGALIGATKEWNDAIWGTNAALLAGDEAMNRFKGGDKVGALSLAKNQTEEMREEAMRLSRELNLLPEIFAKAGMEATKMGLDFKQAQAVMRASGAVFMSDRDADASAMAKALGTYGILYGQEEDPEKYAKQVYDRASALAYGGAVTRTSASAIEEGARNFMGIHGAFGGQFEDLVALIASGSQAAQFEKVTGTSLKQLQARFLRMPAPGYAAMAGAGIDLKKFMDFGAVDPFRATNNIIQSFPQQLGKGARGNLIKFLEKAQREGRLEDPMIISDTMALLERNGLKFAGDEDRDAAYAKLSAIMSGVGGKFDIIGLFAEASKAVKEGRAGPGIFAQIGDPRRIHEYLAMMRMFEDMFELREAIKNDDGNYLKAVEMGYSESEAGRVAKMLGAFQRLQIALMTNQGFQIFVGGLASTFEWLSKLPPELIAVGLGIVGLRTAFGAIAWVVGGLAGSLSAIAGRLGLLALVPAPILAIASALGALGVAVVGWTNIVETFSSAAKVMGETFATIRGWATSISGILPSFLTPEGWRIDEKYRYDPSKYRWGVNRDGSPKGPPQHVETGLPTIDVDQGAGGRIGAFGQQPTDSPTIDVGQGEIDIGASGQQAGGAAHALGEQISQALTLDLFSAGQQAMATFTAGIVAGGAQAIAEANRIASQVRAAGQRVQLNTGPNMMPAR